jgi:trans-2,3-dihydro-3-hydroxyanthranilate isomerase
MGNLPFYIVDVFAEERYAGNQLAVFVGGAGLPDGRMQAIAREVNFSETTFILSEEPTDGGFDVRIFTPAEEVPFAGHPTLGTAHILATEIARTPADRIVLNLGVGPIKVAIERDQKGVIYRMEQIEPQFGKTLPIEELAPVLGLAPDDFSTDLPIEEVSTGLPHIIVPLKNLDALKRARSDRDRYFALIEGAWAGPILMFSPEPHEKGNDISTRMFAECFGIVEDPATGSGNGCLAGYLVKHRWRGRDGIDLKCEQGYEIGRPSLLYLTAREQKGRIEIRVGGRAITVGKGEFFDT